MTDATPLRDRAQLAATEILDQGWAGQLTPDTLAAAVARHATDQEDAKRLFYAVRDVLHERGFDTGRPPKLRYWALAGAAGLLFWCALAGLLFRYVI